MKYINIKLILICSLIFLQLSSIYSRNMYLQAGNGKQLINLKIDWEGLCKKGKYQSPINIVNGKNTKVDSKNLYKNITLRKYNEF